MSQQIRDRDSPRVSGLPSGPGWTAGRGFGLGALAPVVTVAGFLAFAVHGGLPAGSALRALAGLTVTQLLPGVLIWRALRPRHGWWLEDVAMGFALGAVIAVGVQTLAGAVRAPWLSWLLPLAVAAGVLLAPASRRRAVGARTAPLPWWWAPAVCATTLPAVEQVVAFHRQAPLAWASGFRVVHSDAYLHVALAAQLANRGPTRFPWVQSEPLAYHWFSHSWIAQVAVVGRVELDGVVLGFMPSVLPVLIVLAVATAAVRLTGRAWTGPVAALLALAGGDVNVFGQRSLGLPLTPYSPSQSLSVPILIVLVLLIALRWRGELPRAALPLIPLVAFVAAGTKGSTLPILVAGLALSVAAMVVWDRSSARMVLVDLAVVTACLLVALVLVFHGSEAGLTLDPTGAARATNLAGWLGRAGTPRLDLFIAAVTFASMAARGVGLLGAVATRAGRRDPMVWVLAGAGIAGAMAPVLFSHPGESQIYFARSADPLLALGSAVGLVAVLDRLRTRGRLRAVVAVGAVGALTGLAVAVLPARLLAPLTPAGGVRRALELLVVAALLLALGVAAGTLAGGRGRVAAAGTMTVAVLAAGVTVVGVQIRHPRLPGGSREVDAAAPFATSRDEITAARWIRDHSGVDDLVMTNRHCTTPKDPTRCDSRRFVVAAFSERQVLVEGWTATPESTVLAPKGRDSISVAYWKPDLLSLNDGFIATPSALAARRLAALGVRWVYVDHTRPYASTLSPYATLRLSTPGVDVYELARP